MRAVEGDLDHSLLERKKRLQRDASEGRQPSFLLAAPTIKMME
jgi:hypothetical protein